MDDLKAKLKKELADLYNAGVEILLTEVENHKTGDQPKADKAKDSSGKRPIHMAYQAWYSKALSAVRSILPDRYNEFRAQYEPGKRKEIDFVTYTISDYLLGLRVTQLGKEVVNPFGAFSSKFQHQLAILHSALDRLDTHLADIEGLLQAALFDDELATADDLHRKKHLRAAGAVAGVVLETHLRKVSQARGVKLGRKDPTISEYNDALKAASVLDVPTWRFVQRLSDIRNLCVHAKDREPAAEEVWDLLQGTRKVIATIF